ncbi:NAD(P)/FAD-dependent oxidoreductase [Rosistilla oblonga]|uniref:NAD(P)/FAD-dependent oxidoreductase n=1 Tax=Rosistilla oblonga TaxID=2527990 RepID=UPI003A98319A
MNKEVDLLILGSGFGGSLLSLLLARQGLRVAVIDRAVHPRFAIGESSTPLADATLKELAQRYDLPELMPLTAYGPWRRRHPDLMCGLKRGFSYFGHSRGTEFSPADQLLVAASSDDEHSDTHWLRSDVDAWLFERAADRGAMQFEGASYRLSREDSQWLVAGEASGVKFSLRAPMIVDATGAAGEVLRYLKIASQTHQLKTNSWAVYGHFENVASVGEMLDRRQIDRRRHPFACDDAAVHHVLDDGWMWQLRFCDDRVSAGFAIGQPADAPKPNADEIWRQRLDRFPFLRQQFAAAKIVAPASGLQTTSRMQRLTSLAAGPGWAALPNTAGFIDPLHSTGLAHTMFGVRRLAEILLQAEGSDQLANDLENYSSTLIDELRLVDQLVEGCYAGLPSFRLWSAWCMLYFAAVTSMEQSPGGGVAAFLHADDPRFRTVVGEARGELQRALDAGRGPAACERFEAWLRQAIAPWNRVGLLESECDGMYARTAKPV